MRELITVYGIEDVDWWTQLSSRIKLVVEAVLFAIKAVRECDTGVILLILRFISDGTTITDNNLIGLLFTKDSISVIVSKRVTINIYLISGIIVGWAIIGEIFHRKKELKTTLPLLRIVAAKL